MPSNWSSGGVAWSLDRKSTRLNSSHRWISYAVFCLEKKANGRAEFMLHPVGFDDYGPAGPYPLAQRIGRVEVERAEEIAHAVRRRGVIRRGPDHGGRDHRFYDTESHTCRHSVNSSSVRAA